MKKIVLASGNAGKLREFSAMFANHFSEQAIEVIPQNDFNVTEAEENGLSFVENAILKARNAAQQTGLPALADDSGIEVDALNGAPGIYSARYAQREGYRGEESGDAANNAMLLQALKEVPDAQRTARFQCVLVYMRHANDSTPQVFQGSWEGRIVLNPEGHEGFGYDPLFFVESEQCTAAALSKEHKNRISHRGTAMQKLMADIKL
ncbi:RdgB/HAM1 family non-canonical purine NTP pyrophosphatase [Bacterioplanoides sp. SCSIO 12839]|uniref:RdgB/HAM1 family non-canonical purine NTP pyrophosphatase n=1 Tax=Bacterioplanoides sp. SCSIO 12839 TaxID=2829569 RepID=UPI002106A9FF|nr:RdgB/HAM1 family non-canonical purine NTP pyrophosphatase [Bacterioplanoides sp. SCSIO 12839]UTW48461.1 RdgB/HAM1 family non-canonical purine NTP pyrophosphatase [Bacterioplanoides sp. SCSIO 12839]